MAVVPEGEPWRTTQELSGVSQGTMSRWRTGESVPDKAAVVAKFALAYGRNPLEAFVAAEMLTEEEAGKGLSKSDRKFLQEVDATTGTIVPIRDSQVLDAVQLEKDIAAGKKAARRRDQPPSDK